MPKTAAITNMRNLLPTLMSKNLYAASVPANAAKVPITAWTTRLPLSSATNDGVDDLAERAERHALERGEREHQRRADHPLERVDHRQREGAQAADRQRREERAEATVVGGRCPGVMIQVTAAVTITRPRAIAVFWTTESIVIGPAPVRACRRACRAWPVGRWP